MLRRLHYRVFVAFAGNAAFAANPACESQATEKKLSGAAKNSSSRSARRPRRLLRRKPATLRLPRRSSQELPRRTSRRNGDRRDFSR